MTAALDYPKLRPVEIHPATHQGEPVILLQDPLQLSGHTFLVQHPLSAALAFFDGQHTLSEIESSLRVLTGFHVEIGSLAQLVESLDRCLLLETDYYEEALSSALDEYHRAAYRPALLSGHSYPEDPDELRAWLNSFIPASQPDGMDCPSALIVPHLDFERGGQVYTDVYNAGKEALTQADLVVIFGTDHHGPSITPTLTRQDYATPLGLAPTSQAVVEELQAASPDTNLFEHELYHLGEHSIELALIWVQHMRDGRPVEILPILAGSVHEYLEGVTDTAEDNLNQDLARAFRRITRGRNVAMIASGDLAHIGPAFGGEPVDASEAARLHQSDMHKIDCLCRGDIQGFLDAIRKNQNLDSICGSAPIFRLLTWQASQHGRLTGYTQVDADPDGTSLVSACGIVYEK